MGGRSEAEEREIRSTLIVVGAGIVALAAAAFLWPVPSAPNEPASAVDEAPDQSSAAPTPPIGAIAPRSLPPQASQPDDLIPPDAVNGERFRAFLALNEFDLVPLEVECNPDIYGETICKAVPGSTIQTHPYYTYPTESLEAMPGDPIAQQVLSLRTARRDPDQGLRHAIQATGLSNGRPGPLVDFVQNSSWVITEVDGEPAIENVVRSYIVLEAARRLGHSRVYTRDRLETLQEHLSSEELVAVEEEVERLLSVIESVTPARAYQS